MKRSIITIMLAALCLAACTGDKVLHHPAFKSTTSFDIFPVKVELTKDATIVHFHIHCADWRNWSMTGAQLKADGQTFACRQGRIITHEGDQVLADDTFEFGEEYEKDAKKDSVILYFDPLPRGTKTFDYIEGDDPGSWAVCGIRLDNKNYPELLPTYQPRKDDGKPLEPISLKYGEATATFTMLGDTVNQMGWSGNSSLDPVTSEYNVKDEREGAVCHYSQPACTAIKPLFIGPKVDTDGFGGQYDLILIPGETLTVDFDQAACYAWMYDFAAGKPSHNGYRLGGTIGDLNEVLMDNRRHLFFTMMSEIPKNVDAKDFPEWREKLWQNLDTLRQGVMNRKDYTRRQKDFFSLLVDRAYMHLNVICLDLLAWKDRLPDPDADLAHLRKTYTLIDPHAKDLEYYRDGRSFWLPLAPKILPYLEANGLTESEPYKMTKAMAEAQEIGEVIKQGQVLPESEIEKAHPYFQRVLREFNDSTRAHLELLEKKATERMRPTPNVPGEKLLETIVKEHPGKAVFFDLWATWCGPCRRGIDAMEPLKEQLKGKDIVFVYVTDVSSPMNEWEESVLNIPGLHYRLPSEKWGKLPIQGGIPQYFLYNRQGKKIWEQTGFSDKVLEDIKKQIAKALE